MADRLGSQVSGRKPTGWGRGERAGERVEGRSMGSTGSSELSRSLGLGCLQATLDSWVRICDRTELGGRIYPAFYSLPAQGSFVWFPVFLGQDLCSPFWPPKCDSPDSPASVSQVLRPRGLVLVFSSERGSQSAISWTRTGYGDLTGLEQAVLRALVSAGNTGVLHHQPSLGEQIATVFSVPSQLA